MALECLIGRVLAENFIETARRHPAHRQTMLRSTLLDMIRGGKVSGIEVAFIERITATLMPDTGGGKVAVLKAVVTQPDGSRGIYQTE